MFDHCIESKTTNLRPLFSLSDPEETRRKRDVNGVERNETYVPSFEFKSALAKCKAFSEKEEKWVDGVCTVRIQGNPTGGLGDGVGVEDIGVRGDMQYFEI